ncbi:hypothetical protein FANTH_4414 [Fusarium anthophilum]|uniref:Carboxymuconolactone decarboxylase-like domain-containing protein n=1 Tax=Fusarium anthophilum TaxID=48485 RepID=A0A8H4ZQL4_9HYPO|nr:hypothetical protein FANTH_4414 [Fusarium anthophilum]
MCDWDEDETMSAWDAKYVSTNVKPGAKPYDKDFFLNLDAKLAASSAELSVHSYAIVAIACVAVGRADVVGRFFDDITAGATPEVSQKRFLIIREAITISFPYIGMPSCMPACYGMIGVVQRKGSEFASRQILRSRTITKEDVGKGEELRARIYKGVGNSEIFALMDTYFTDLFTCSTVVTWGYLISKATEGVFTTQQAHLIVASAIMALGATRQTRSHVKATLGIGNSIACVKAVVGAVAEIAEWGGRPINAVDVEDMARQIQEALKA